MKSCGKWLIVLCAACLSSAEADDPTLVTLPYGQIRGRALLSPDNNTYYAFQEVPYAAPPVGELRFQLPTAPPKWDGVLNTTENTKMCYQSSIDAYSLVNMTQSEDCLHLNVYTPLKPGDSSETPLPVLLWIHGGGFNQGAAVFQLSNPQYFIDHHIVVVTIHYRIGTLGFLTTEDGIIPGNLGLKDQHFAIQWVKDNIGLFGGDPEQVVIGGQSAGGASVGLQLISPRNKGLFKGAILQSGTGLAFWSHQNYARDYAFKLGQILDANFTSNDSEELLKLLQSAPADDISYNTIAPNIGKETDVVEGGGLIWLPVIEDENLEDAFLTNNLYEDVRTGNINQVPILIGFTSEEELLFAVLDISPLLLRAKYFANDSSNLIGNKFNMTQKNKLTAGTRLGELYTNRSFDDDLGAVIRFTSDDIFTTPVIRHAKLQSNYTDVYMYEFSYKGKMGGLKDVEIAGVQGVGHVEELGYMWDTRISWDGTPDDPEDVMVRHQLLTLWSNFVKYLNPTPEKQSILGNITWEKVAPNNLVYLNINTTLEMKTNPKQYLQWERIIDVYAIPPLNNY